MSPCRSRVPPGVVLALLLGVVGAAVVEAMSPAALMRFTATARSSSNQRADSGGCAPLPGVDLVKDNPEWWNWEKRLSALARKAPGDVLFGLGADKQWMQIIDGWSHPRNGAESFGSGYVADATKAQTFAAELLKSGLSAQTLTPDWYLRMHNIAFKGDAASLGKRNGFRDSGSGIYLPMPDKPMGVFHLVQNKGKVGFDTKIAEVGKSEAPADWKWNDKYLRRWLYKDTSEEHIRALVQRYFDKFWQEVPKNFNGADNRLKALRAVANLYHRLENMHPFVDGTGRTNYIMLNTLLSHCGLHPASIYNTMESALGSEEEELHHVLEGYLMWEKHVAASATTSAWTQERINEKNKECDFHISVLMGETPAPNGYFIPDTLSGCMCKEHGACKGKPQGKCAVDEHCFLGDGVEDSCAPGAANAAASSSSSSSTLSSTSSSSSLSRRKSLLYAGPDGADVAPSAPPTAGDA